MIRVCGKNSIPFYLELWFSLNLVNREEFSTYWNMQHNIVFIYFLRQLIFYLFKNKQKIFRKFLKFFKISWVSWLKTLIWLLLISIQLYIRNIWVHFALSWITTAPSKPASDNLVFRIIVIVIVFDLTQFIVWNILGLRNWVVRI